MSKTAWTRNTAAAALATLLGALAGAPLLAQGFGGTVTDMLVRGESLLDQQRPNEAIVQYQEARTLCATPHEMVVALEGEAKGHLQLKEFLPAAGLLEEAIQKYPDDPRAADLLYLAGVARQRGDDLQGAVPLFQKALEHHPTPDLLPGLKFQLSQALRLTGQPGKVVELLKDFETENPQHVLIPNVLYTLGIAQHDLKDDKAAETTYRHLIKDYPHTQAALEAFSELGGVLADEGNRKEAADYFRRYANGNPSSPVAARSMERAADATFFSSPKEAALLYGVAQVKAKTNPVLSLPELQVSRWLGLKRSIATALSNVWLLSGAGVVIVAAIVVALLLRRRRGRDVAIEPDTAGV